MKYSKEARPMVKAFFLSKQWRWWAYGGGLLLFLLLLAQVNISVRLNDVYGQYGDLLQIAKERGEEGLVDFWALTLQWGYLGLISVSLYVVVNLCARFYAFAWREAITRNYIPRLTDTPKRIEGESQRVQEDTKEFAEIVESLGLQAVKSVMTLMAFLPILWHLSNAVNLGAIKYIVAHPPMSVHAQTLADVQLYIL